MLPSSKDRVPSQTSERDNRRIHQQMFERVRDYSGHPEEIGERIDQLDREWDVERALEVNASSLMLVSILLGAAADRRWLLLSGTVAGFLLQHGLQGWCPPLPVLRKLGFRTRAEIDEERYALKALRGDFSEAVTASSAHRAAHA